ncbi:hypothetical protein C8R44DRAFT_802883 [Mycena epipterygia]|nr:hypothetical protein C8R44DRAFT_802883 [Mycena epipterygia]
MSFSRYASSTFSYTTGRNLRDQFEGVIEGFKAESRRKLDSAMANRAPIRRLEEMRRYIPSSQPRIPAMLPQDERAAGYNQDGRGVWRISAIHSQPEIAPLQLARDLELEMPLASETLMLLSKCDFTEGFPEKEDCRFLAELITNLGRYSVNDVMNLYRASAPSTPSAVRRKELHQAADSCFELFINEDAYDNGTPMDPYLMSRYNVPVPYL